MRRRDAQPADQKLVDLDQAAVGDAANTEHAYELCNVLPNWPKLRSMPSEQ
jgi:hypothetical protein